MGHTDIEAVTVVASPAESTGSRAKTDAAYESATSLLCGSRSRPHPPRERPEEHCPHVAPGPAPELEAPTQGSVGISWQQAAFLITGVQLSFGIVLFQYPFGQQGYVLGTVSLLGMGALCCYTVSLLARIKHNATPWVCSFQDLALEVGGRATKTVVGCIIELAWVIGAMMSFSLAETALRDALSDASSFVSPIQCKLILGACIWPIAQLQSLAGASWLSLGSTVGVLVAVGLSIGSLAVQGQQQDAAQVGIICDEDPGMDAAVSSLCSQYGIQALLIYTSLLMVQDFVLDVMDGMRDSKQFHRANVAAYGMSCSVALATGVACLALVGELEQSYLISNVSEPTIRVAANALVALKGVVLYVVWNLLLVSTWARRIRACVGERKPQQAVSERERETSKDCNAKAPFHDPTASSPPIPTSKPVEQGMEYTENAAEPNLTRCCWPSFTASRWSLRLQWAFSSTVLMAASFLGTQLIPSLASLTGLAMAVIGPPVMFGLPAWFFLKSSAKCSKLRASRIESALCVLLLFVVTPLLTILGTGCSLMSLIGSQCTLT